MGKVIVEKLDSNNKSILPLEQDEEVAFVLIGFEPGSKEVVVELKGEGAHAKILGLFVGHEGEMKVRTTQHHQAANTTSDLLFKTILFNGAKFGYQGLIKIDQDAQNSNAYQRNDNLAIGSEAKVDTKPELEILANEVRCTHGATVGKLDEEQIYYLQTRGLSRDRAVEILLEGFLGEVLERIDDEGKQTEVRSMVMKKLSMA